LFPEKDTTVFYESKKEFTLQRLDAGIAKIGLQKPRPKEGMGIFINPDDSYDYKRAVEAHTVKTKPRSVNLTNFSKQRPRDDLLLNGNERLKNVMLENTKEVREE